MQILRDIQNALSLAILIAKKILVNNSSSHGAFEVTTPTIILPNDMFWQNWASFGCRLIHRSSFGWHLAVEQFVDQLSITWVYLS